MSKHTDLMNALRAWDRIVNPLSDISDVEDNLSYAFHAFKEADVLVLEGVDLCDTKMNWFVNRSACDSIRLDGKCYRLPEADDENI